MREYCSKCHKEITTSSTNANQLCLECSMGLTTYYYPKEVKMQEPKFTIGQTVRVKYQKRHHAFILDKIIEECCGGVQIHYIVRLFGKGKYGGIDQKQLTKFNEIELEAIPEQSLKEIEIQNKIKELQLAKEDAIRKQEWETATKFRDEERLLRQRLELLVDDEI